MLISLGKLVFPKLQLHWYEHKN